MYCINKTSKYPQRAKPDWATEALRRLWWPWRSFRSLAKSGRGFKQPKPITKNIDLYLKNFNNFDVTYFANEANRLFWI